MGEEVSLADVKLNRILPFKKAMKVAEENWYHLSLGLVLYEGNVEPARWDSNFPGLRIPVMGPPWRIGPPV